MQERLSLLVVAALLVASDANGMPTTPATVIGSEDVSAKLSGATPDVNTFVKTVAGIDILGGHLNIDVLRRLKGEGRGLVHNRVTEVYEVLDGGGVLLSGGVLSHPKPLVLTPDTLTIGPSQEGPGIEGGTARRIRSGDKVIIPAGTPHEFTSINGHVTYVVIRFDPKH